MFTSITAVEDFKLDEQIPRSSPPWVWVGFIFGIAIFFVGVTFGVLEVMGYDPDTLALLDLLIRGIAITAWIYWLWCIHRIHRIMSELTSNRYSISPGESVWKHIVPILNLIWMFQWPAQLSQYLNDQGRVKMISGNVIGALLLLSFVLRLVDASFGTFALFGVTMFVNSKVREHVKTLKRATAEELPPLPDPAIFGRPLENVSSPIVETADGSQVG